MNLQINLIQYFFSTFFQLMSQCEGFYPSAAFWTRALQQYSSGSRAHRWWLSSFLLPGNCLCIFIAHAYIYVRTLGSFVAVSWNATPSATDRCTLFSYNPNWRTEWFSDWLNGFQSFQTRRPTTTPRRRKHCCYDSPVEHTQSVMRQKKGENVVLIALIWDQGHSRLHHKTLKTTTTRRDVQYEALLIFCRPASYYIDYLYSSVITGIWYTYMYHTYHTYVIYTQTNY